MNGPVRRQRDYSGIIGIGLVVILMAIILSFGVTSFAAGDPDFSGAHELTLNNQSFIQISSAESFPILSFTPSEDGNYVLLLTTYSDLHVVGSVDEYEGNTKKATLTGDYGQHKVGQRTEYGRKFENLALEAGTTYYFVPSPDAEYNNGWVSLTCLITKAPSETDPDFSGAYELTLNNQSFIQISSAESFPILSFTPSEDGNYVLLLTTYSDMHVVGPVDEYEGNTKKATLTGDYGQHKVGQRTEYGRKFENLSLKAGKKYYFVTHPDDEYTGSPVSLTCLIKKTEPFSDAIQLTLDKVSHVFFRSENDLPILSFSPRETGEYVLYIATGNNLQTHIIGSVDEYEGNTKKATLPGEYGLQQLDSSNYGTYSAYGRKYEPLTLDAGKTYYFVTALDSELNVGFPCGIDCLIKKVEREPDFSEANVLKLDKTSKINVTSADGFPILSFTPSTSGEYVLQITTSSDLHVSKNVDEYSKKSSSSSISKDKKLSGKYGFYSEGFGYKFEKLDLKAGRTYYFVTTQDSNYSFASGELTCLITKAKTDPELDADNVTGTYGETGLKIKASTEGDSPLSYAVTSGKDVVSVNANTGALTVKKAGKATVTVTAAETDTYAEATKDVTVTIKKAKITIKANDKTILVGQNAPDLGKGDYTVTGLVNGDKLAKEPTIKYERTPDTSVAGSVAIKVSGAEVPDKNNYDSIEYENGVLTITALQPFIDVNSRDYFAPAVDWAVANGVTTGITPTVFGPYEPCTRAQMVTFLWRAAGSPNPGSGINPFNDIKSSDYYYKAVTWATQKGITIGTSATTFSPNDSVTRAQSVAFLYRYAKGTATGSNPFKDVSSSDYYYDAVRWAVRNGITQGTTATTFSPDADCLRSQIVTLLYRFFE